MRAILTMCDLLAWTVLCAVPDTTAITAANCLLQLDLCERLPLDVKCGPSSPARGHSCVACNARTERNIILGEALRQLPRPGAALAVIKGVAVPRIAFAINVTANASLSLLPFRLSTAACPGCLNEAGGRALSYNAGDQVMVYVPTHGDPKSG